MGRRLGILVCLSLAACYQPPHPNCGFVCGADFACPEDYTCAADGICHWNQAPTGTTCYADARPAPDATDANLTPPMLVSTTPLGGASNVSRTEDITATFDQPITGVSPVSFLVYNNAPQLTGNVTYDIGTQTAHFTPVPPLPAGAGIQVTLTTAIHNNLGVPFDGYGFVFTTIDDQPPTLASSNPLDMATMVPTSSTIEVVFNETVTGVDTTSLTVAQGVTPITGTVAGTTNDYIFTPSAALPSGQVITVSLSAAIVDLAGNALVPVQFTFTTQ
jgi:hypothetical protein